MSEPFIEAYYKKSTLAILFTEMLKKHEDKKDFMLMLWENIKSFPEDKDCGDCTKCNFQKQCFEVDAAKVLLKKYHNISDTDDYWQRLVHESSDIIGKNDTRFTRALVHAVLEEISEVSRKTAFDE